MNPEFLTQDPHHVLAPQRAHAPVGLRERPGVKPLFQRIFLVPWQMRGLARSRPVPQPVDPFGVVTPHPLLHRPTTQPRRVSDLQGRATLTRQYDHLQPRGDPAMRLEPTQPAKMFDRIVGFNVHPGLLAKPPKATRTDPSAHLSNAS